MPERQLLGVTKQNEAYISKEIEKTHKERAKEDLRSRLLISVFVSLFVSGFVCAVLAFILIPPINSEITHNCGNISALGSIQSKRDAAQNSQTNYLLSHHITFGIPKAELPKIISDSRKEQKREEKVLNELATANCKSVN